MALAIAYGRQSDTANRNKANESDEESLSCRAQLDGCIRLATENGDKIVKEFSEQFTSFTADRPDLQAMLALIKENRNKFPKDSSERIKKLYIYKYGRLARGKLQTFLLTTLDNLDIEVIPVAEKQYTKDLAGELIQFVSSLFSAQQVKDALDQANETRRTLTENGKLICAGKAIYGYRYDFVNGKGSRQRVIDDVSAPTVRKIFQAIADGMSVYSLTDLLTKEEVPTPRGKLSRWCEKTITRIITNESYKGNKMVGYKYRPDDEKRYANGKKVINIVEGKPVGDCTPSIVTEELWDRANRLIEQSRRKPRSYEYWLKGRVRCGNCGRMLVRTYQSNRDRFQWTCSGNTHKKGCPNHYTNNRDIEPEAWQRLLRWVKDADVIEAKLKELELQLFDPSREELAKKNQSQLKAKKKKLGELLEAFGEDQRKAVRDACEVQIERLSSEIESLEELGKTYADSIREAEDARRRCQDLKTQIRRRIDEGAATEEEKTKLADAVGLSVVVWRLPDKTRFIAFNAFDYARKTLYAGHNGASSEKDFLSAPNCDSAYISLPDGYTGRQTRDR